MRHLLAFSSALLLLAGCAVGPLGGPHVDPLKDAVAVYSWEAQGQMVFRCAYDEQGFFWEFIRPEGRLIGDNGRQQAVLQKDFAVTARDGSAVSARIVDQGPQISARDLREVVFAAESSGRGILSGVRWIARKNPSGGMPLASCTASQRGHYLKVPFRARYVFYR
ncbi:DUF3455 domain-containing protein [uncultured Sutterella sp.]|uniref:DUF3455 domain-containing protein n=1 Tax=uncultured Sutterella sp. TaxID=286133 RepID=UPI0025D1AD65|nr:DUF3455 domain-containing protein [uncultured Sutterella sp.]